MPDKYIVATVKSWNVNNFQLLKKSRENSWFLIDKPEDLMLANIRKIKPRYIFFPHWSWIIPRQIWSNFECVVFHMTDLPYGRGGTPLQNLIVRGHTHTKISAIKVDAGLDRGDIYCKEKMSLRGSAEEIYRRVSKIIFTKMIPDIIRNNPLPQKQAGKAIIFKRRTPAQSKILNGMDITEAYNIIRMLDAEGYPRAFLETKKLKFDFFKARLKNNKLTAKVKIYEK